MVVYIASCLKSQIIESVVFENWRYHKWFQRFISEFSGRGAGETETNVPSAAKTAKCVNTKTLSALVSVSPAPRSGNRTIDLWNNPWYFQFFETGLAIICDVEQLCRVNKHPKINNKEANSKISIIQWQSLSASTWKLSVEISACLM